MQRLITRARCATLLVLVLCLPVLAPAADRGIIDAALRSVPPHSAFGVALWRLGDGTELYAYDAAAPRRLASVAKLYVSAGALLALGPEHRLRTRIYSLGPLRAGVAPGLLIVGGGNPCLDEHFTDGEPERIFSDWIGQLQAAGIRSVDGPVLVDGSLFQGPERPLTYPQDHANLQKWYSAPASAFAWLDNCIEVQVRPGSPGGPARVLIRPDSPRITVINKTSTVASQSRPRLIVSRAHHENRIIVSGSYAKPTAWFPLAIHADADLLHADHFCGRLLEAGITAPRMSQPGLLVEHPAAELLIEHSDPLLPAVDILNTRSLNVYGEQLLRLVAVARGAPGSIADGCRETNAVLREAGVAVDDLILLDGSGLSYDNRASARGVCRLLHRMHNHRHGSAYRASMKRMDTAGVTAHVKTGTLSVARCLAGYFDRGGERYAFAILVERERASGGWSAQARRAYTTILDALVRAVPGP
ncbi:MAG: D-alanyl-D-alanine carboxypeptidase/D-alanyl-D-alanine-endopeptidase [Planctomycetota bacterium]